ncbi:hypothetical protein E3P81_02500 [Wallemia ichthyophaga]|nr:hypothetical protein E3P97_02508 [Wallemia ichthyophaga]TIB06758.1 hypothetical protein E3P96_00097 [Wallemia ichthyophaga]TIB31532.1 hypothetical protein E3P85_02224 [Wallemia ichthyophaga]TIB45934.1 hypothetical protein E3P82_02500 [Wallemia ichthyophaga]TIB49544.1 hypothetical protein E3P81_02500 [Wallemia ichthyophaga]
MTSAILFGSTGAVGKHLKACLLTSADIGHVTEAARSVDNTTNGKLTQIKLDANTKLHPQYDLVFITLGTTAKNAGSSEKFEEIDRHLVVNLAKQVSKDSAHGLTEMSLSELGYSSTTIFRPGFLKHAKRSDSRPAESFFGYLTGFLGYFTSAVEIPVQKLGESMVLAGLKQLKEKSNKTIFVSNKEALNLN